MMNPLPVMLVLLGLPWAAQERAAEPRQERDFLTLAFYDVRDLLGEEEDGREAAGRALVGLVQEEMQPAYRDGATELQMQQGALIVRATPRQHEWCEEFLRTQRDRPEMVFIDSHMFLVSKEDFARLSLPGPNSLLEAGQVKQVLAALTQGEVTNQRSNLLMAPRVLVQPRQEAQICVLNQVSYIKDWRREVVEPGHRVIADPVVDVVGEGVEARYRLHPVGDHSYSVDLSVEQSQVERPIPTVTTAVEGLGEREVAVPTVRSTKLQCKLVVPDGAGAVFSGAALEEGMIQGVLFVVRSLDPDSLPVEGRKDR